MREAADIRASVIEGLEDKIFCRTSIYCTRLNTAFTISCCVAALPGKEEKHQSADGIQSDSSYIYIHCSCISGDDLGYCDADKK